jgi:hypothetical protein
MLSVFGDALLRNILTTLAFIAEKLMTYLSYQLTTFILAVAGERTRYQMLYAPARAAIRTKEVMTGSLG